MMKSLAAIGLVALTGACASAPDRGPDGPPLAAVGPQVFVSPFGEPFQSQPGEPYPVAAWFSAADTDVDGRISRTEFTNDGARFFMALDADNDGVIGTGEIIAYESMTARLFAGGGHRGPGGSMGGQRGGGGHGPVGGGSLGLADATDQDEDMTPSQMSGPPRRRFMPESSVLAMAGLLNVPEPVKAADTDTNQRITPEEWTQAGDRWFALLDTDRNGYLTLAELPKTALQRGGGERGRR
jgi:hypothetical protein